MDVPDTFLNRARRWLALVWALPLSRFAAALCCCAVALLATDSSKVGEAGIVRQLFTGNPDDVRFDLEAIAEGALPAAQPVTYLRLSQDRARQINSAVAFSSAPNTAALPFILGGDVASKERAVDCLAAAQYYETGTDWEGQRAVAQVVLNRARHPAYPNTVCGVVFQGMERRTGCQFSFTCDGAMRRTPSVEHWERTRLIARMALRGDVYAKVGLATHYHTDWVVPAWSSQLEKITNVATHLFFRWPGNIGKPGAFSVAASGTEPVILPLARLSSAHRNELSDAEVEELELELGDEGEFLAEAAPNPLEGAMSSGPMPPAPAAARVDPMAGINLRGSQLLLANSTGDGFGFLVPRELPGSFGLLAYDVCGRRAFCRVMGWTDAAAAPPSFPGLSDVPQGLAFFYYYDRANRREIMAWNCDVFPRRNAGECLTEAMLR